MQFLLRLFVLMQRKKITVLSRVVLKLQDVPAQWFPDLEMVPTFIYCPADAGVIDNENVVFSNSTCHTGAM